MQTKNNILFHFRSLYHQLAPTAKSFGRQILQSSSKEVNMINLVLKIPELTFVGYNAN